MPAGPVIGIINWFASHLVLWSLLGFLIGGLVVFDVVQLPGSFAKTTPLVGHDRDAAESAPSASSVVQPAATRGATDLPASGGETVKRPKLIGGSLPLYEDRPVRGEGAGTATADGFRPPTETAQSSPAPSYDDLIQHARRAFWNGNFEAAEAAYMDVIAAFPDDPEAFGELGNLYEATGQAELARDAFFAAGVRLRNRGDREKLRKVIDLLAEKGDERSTLLTR